LKNGTIPKIQNMTHYKPGDIVLVKFPFTNLDTIKQRPALVLHHTFHTSKIDIMGIAMITSQIENYRLKGDVLIKKWKDASLLHPSLIRLSKMATIDATLIKKKLGQLKAADIKSTKKTFSKLFGFWL